MGEQSPRVFPMIVLLLDRVRRVSVVQARRAVGREIGEDAAATVQLVQENPEGMEYIDWRFAGAHYHLGTSPDPYIDVVGELKRDPSSGKFVPVKWTIHEEVPPEGDAAAGAWMRHTAWLYVDALLFHSRAEDDGLHLGNVLRIASHFVDERCVLLWQNGGEPKRVALPTPQAVARLRAGEWPK